MLEFGTLSRLHLNGSSVATLIVIAFIQFPSFIAHSRLDVSGDLLYFYLCHNKIHTI